MFLDYVVKRLGLEFKHEQKSIKQFQYVEYDMKVDNKIKTVIFYKPLSFMKICGENIKRAFRYFNMK